MENCKGVEKPFGDYEGNTITAAYSCSVKVLCKRSMLNASCIFSGVYLSRGRDAWQLLFIAQANIATWCFFSRAHPVIPGEGPLPRSSPS